MSDRPPRPGRRPEGVGDDEFLRNELRPNDLLGSSPLVSMAVGKTPAGTGFCLMRSTRSSDPGKSLVMVFQRRWLDAPESDEECLMIMHQALGWWLRENGIPTL